MNPVLENILSRRSIRSYKNEPVPAEEIKSIVEAGRFAASGMNRQPWHFVAIQDNSARQALDELVKTVLGRPSDPFYKAPAIIIVFGDASNNLAKADCSLALGNMMLATHSLGLGSCWINCVIDLFLTEQGKTLQKEYGVPDDYVAMGSLALGYIDGDIPEARPRKENAETYLL